jgi:hypothetical protein
MAENIDKVYQKSREDLLDYEDSRMKSLLSAVPNFYAVINENSVFGELLRAVAIELARLEYNYAYDLVSKDPNFLTPADIKRKFSDPCYISKNYPNDLQGDLDYKNMLKALIPAYKAGSNSVSLAEITAALTGQNLTVQELYKFIGTGPYDISDKNTIRVAAVIGTNVFSTINNINELQAVTEDLYTALDYAKPAHVGLDLQVIFGSDESIDSYITEITDTLRIYVRLVEAQPLEAMLTAAPLLDPNSPDTQQAASGRVVGSLFNKLITTAQYNALQSAAFQAEYTGPDGSGNYALNLSCYTDVALVDASGNLTGAISKARGLISPQINSAWEITSDHLDSFEID